MASPTPEERAARALPPCPCGITAEDQREHDADCCAGEVFTACAAAIREAEREAWRRGAEAMKLAALEVLQRDMNVGTAAEAVGVTLAYNRVAYLPTPPADPT